MLAIWVLEIALLPQSRVQDVQNICRIVSVLGSNLSLPFPVGTACCLGALGARNASTPPVPALSGYAADTAAGELGAFSGFVNPKP